MPKIFNQNSQSDIAIKKRLVNLLVKDAINNSDPLKVSGTTETNANIFETLEKQFNEYLLYLDELFGAFDDQELPEVKYNKLYTKIRKTAFDLKKSLKKIKPKTLTNGEIEVLTDYKNTLIISNESLKDIAEEQTVKDNEEIIKLCEIINTRISIDTTTIQPGEDLIGGYLPKRFR